MFGLSLLHGAGSGMLFSPSPALCPHCSHWCAFHQLVCSSQTEPPISKKEALLLACCPLYLHKSPSRCHVEPMSRRCWLAGPLACVLNGGQTLLSCPRQPTPVSELCTQDSAISEFKRGTDKALLEFSPPPQTLSPDNILTTNSCVTIWFQNTYAMV